MYKNPVITIDKNYASVSEVVYCMDLHQLITIRKPFQLLITINDKQLTMTMTMPQAITILSSVFLFFANSKIFCVAKILFLT